MQRCRRTETQGEGCGTGRKRAGQGAGRWNHLEHIVVVNRYGCDSEIHANVPLVVTGQMAVESGPYTLTCLRMYSTSANSGMSLDGYEQCSIGAKQALNKSCAKWKGTRRCCGCVCAVTGCNSSARSRRRGERSATTRSSTVYEVLFGTRTVRHSRQALTHRRLPRFTGSAPAAAAAAAAA